MVKRPQFALRAVRFRTRQGFSVTVAPRAFPFEVLLAAYQTLNL